MKKKIIASTILVLLFALFSIPVVFANNETPFNGTKDAIRNTVGGAENIVENAARDVTNGVRDITNINNDKARLDTNNNQNNNNDNNNKNNQTIMTRTTNNNNNGNNGRYTATRTDATTFLGMTSNAWTWLIMGIVGVAIIALVWYYTKSNSSFENNQEQKY